MKTVAAATIGLYQVTAEQGYPQRYRMETLNDASDEDYNTFGGSTPAPSPGYYGPDGYNNGQEHYNTFGGNPKDGYTGSHYLPDGYDAGAKDANGNGAWSEGGHPPHGPPNPASDSPFNHKNEKSRYLQPTGLTGTPGYGGGPLVDQDWTAAAVCPRPDDFCRVNTTKNGHGPACWSPELDYDWQQKHKVDSCCGYYQPKIVCSYVADKHSGLTWCYCYDIEKNKKHQTDAKTNKTMPLPCCFWDYYPTKDMYTHPNGGNFVARPMTFNASDFYPEDMLNASSVEDGTTVWGVQNEGEWNYHRGDVNDGPVEGRGASAGSFGYVPMKNDHEHTQPYSNWHNANEGKHGPNSNTNPNNNGLPSSSDQSGGWNGQTGKPWWSNLDQDDQEPSKQTGYGPNGYSTNTWASLVQESQSEIIPTTSAIMPQFGAAPLISFIQKQQRESIGAENDWDASDWSSPPGRSTSHRDMYAHNDQWGRPSHFSHESNVEINNVQQQQHPKMRGSMQSHQQNYNYYRGDEDEDKGQSDEPAEMTMGETGIMHDSGWDAGHTTPNFGADNFSSPNTEGTNNQGTGWSNPVIANTKEANSKSITYVNPDSDKDKDKEHTAADHHNTIDPKDYCFKILDSNTCDKTKTCGWTDDQCLNTTQITVITHDNVNVIFDQSCNDVAFKIGLADIACNQNTAPGYQCRINSTNAQAAMCVDLDNGGFAGVDYVEEATPFQGSCCQAFNPNQLECRVFCLSNDNNKSDFHFAYGVFAWNHKFAEAEKATKTYRMQKKQYSFLQTGDNSEIEVEIELDQDQNEFGYQGEYGNRGGYRYETHPNPDQLKTVHRHHHSQSSAQQHEDHNHNTGGGNHNTGGDTPDDFNPVDGNGGHSISQEDGHKYWNRACCAYMVNVEQANAKDKGIDPDDDGKNSATGLVSAFAIFMPFVAVLFMQ